MKIRSIPALAVSGVMLLAMMSPFAMAEDVEPIVDYRQGAMSAVGGNISAVAAIVMSGADFRDNLPEHTRALVALTEDIPALFPEGSEHADSDARAAIWEDFEAFESLSFDTHEAARNLHEAVTAGADDAELMSAFRVLGESCRSCHDDFRD